MNVCSLINGSRRFFALATLIAAGLCPSSSRAAELASLDRHPVHAVRPHEAPLVRETYETYTVSGTTLPELRAGLRRSGIRMSDGTTFDALASWDVRWEYGHLLSAAGCSVDDFRAFVDVTIRYPNWATDAVVSDTLADAWDSYLHSLIRHEQGHRDIAVAAADALTRAVAALAPSTDCSAMDRAVASLGRSYMRRLSLNQRSYDSKTDHGALQGAFLPDEEP